MALHLQDTDDEPRIVWVCAKHSLLFYAGDDAVVTWVHDGPQAELADVTHVG
jgi:hypothetical protein